MVYQIFALITILLPIYGLLKSSFTENTKLVAKFRKEKDFGQLSGLLAESDGMKLIFLKFMEMKLIEEEDWKGEEVLLDIGLEKIFDSGYFIISPNSWVQYEYTINLENETIYMLGESGEEFWSFNNLDKLLKIWRFNPLVF